MIYCYNFSEPGQLHLELGLPCQDASKVVKASDRLGIAALADGVGSHKNSDIASSKAVEVVCRICSERITENSSDENIIEVLRFAFEQAVREIASAALQNLHDLNSDYGTTLDLAVLRNGTLFYGHSGDGGILVMNADGTIEKITEEQNDYDGAVFHLQYDNGSKWVFAKHSQAVASVLLTSDGLLDGFMPAKYSIQAVKVHIPLASFFMDNEVLKIEEQGESLIQESRHNFVRSFDRVVFYDDNSLSVLIDTSVVVNRQPEAYYNEPDSANSERIDREWQDHLQKKLYPGLLKLAEETYSAELSLETAGQTGGGNNQTETGQSLTDPILIDVFPSQATTTRLLTAREFVGRRGQNYLIDVENGKQSRLGFDYPIQSEDGVTARIFLPREASKEREEKLIQVIEHPITEDLMRKLTLPLDCLYDQSGTFVGYTFRDFGAHGILADFLGYDENPKLSVDQRIKLAINLSELVMRLHFSGILIGDFNPSIFGVDFSNGDIKCLDTLSFQFANSQKMSNSPKINRPEAAKTLGQAGHVALSQDVSKIEQPSPGFSRGSDLFSLAIFIFKLVMNGASPFCGVPDNKINRANRTTEELLVGHGPYCFTPGFKPGLDYVPAKETLPTYLIHLFDQTFILGLHNPAERTNAQTWMNVLGLYRRELLRCNNDPLHYYYTGLESCPLCVVRDRKDVAQNQPNSPLPTQKTSIQSMPKNQVGTKQEQFGKKDRFITSMLKGFGLKRNTKKDS